MVPRNNSGMFREIAEGRHGVLGWYLLGFVFGVTPHLLSFERMNPSRSLTSLPSSPLLLLFFVSFLQKHAVRELCLPNKINTLYVVAWGHHTISSFSLLKLLAEVRPTVTSSLLQFIDRVLSGHRHSGLSVHTHQSAIRQNGIPKSNNGTTSEIPTVLGT